MAVLSASSSYGFSDRGDYFYYFKRQFISFIVGFVAMGFFIKLNYKKLRHKAKEFANYLIVLLFFTMILGKTTLGAARWFLGIQQSELAMPLCINFACNGIV
jgi:cell division protein FtsW (lipid II flippase)